MAKIDDLEAQLKLARKDIETLAAMAGATAQDAAQEVASEALDTASERLAGLSEEAQKIYLEAIKEGRKAGAAAQAQIKANPLAATGIAFVIGMIVAALLNRR